MTENNLNTNPTSATPATPSVNDPLSGMAASDHVAISNPNKLAAAATPAAKPADGSAPAKGEKGNLDLSGLAATVQSFSSTKAPEKKIDFNVQKETSQKEKIMQAAVFERTFFNKMTKTISFGLVAVVLAVGGYSFQQYLHFIKGEPVSSVVDYYMPTIHTTYLKVASMFGQNTDAYGIDSLTTANAQVTLNTIVNDQSLNYILKKEVLNRAVDQLSKSAITQYSKLDEIKQDIGSYGFFPKDVQTFAASTFVDNSLQKSLIAVEAIRFSTALTFFSNLDTFVQQFSSFLTISAPQLDSILAAYKSRSEKDIQNYLTTCYFNPYVSADSCNMPQGNDFMNYYTYVDTKANIDKKDFPILMNYLDAKLENTDFPSLEINIKSFDPLQNQISFSIDLNTFQEDELQLLNKGILNPHIYLATKIIDLLRESKFVVAESINLSTLKVNKKKLRVGAQEFIVNNSTFDFTLPLQKNAEREIYDYDQRQ